MEQEQIQKTVEEAIRLLSNINQSASAKTCMISPELQHEIKGAGLLRGNPSISIVDLQRVAPSLNVKEKCGEFSQIEFYCYVPNLLPLHNPLGYKVFGIDGSHKVVVVYDSFPYNIYNYGNRVDYAFLVSVK